MSLTQSHRGMKKGEVRLVPAWASRQLDQVLCKLVVAHEWLPPRRIIRLHWPQPDNAMPGMVELRIPVVLAITEGVLQVGQTQLTGNETQVVMGLIKEHEQ